MKKITAIILSIFILLGIYYPCNIFAASIPTTTITSVKAQSKAFTVKWKKKSGITKFSILLTVNLKRETNQ